MYFVVLAGQNYARQAEAIWGSSQAVEIAFADLVLHGYRKLSPIFSGEAVSELQLPEKLSGQPPVQDAKAAELVSLCRSLQSVVDKEANRLAGQAFHSNQERLVSYAGLSRKTLGAAGAIDNYLKGNEVQAEAIWSSWQRLCSLFWLLAWLSIAGSIALALMIASYFNRGIVARLLALENLVGALGKGQFAIEQLDEKAMVPYSSAKPAFGWSTANAFLSIEQAFTRLFGEINKSRRESAAIVGLLAADLDSTVRGLGIEADISEDRSRKINAALHKISDFAGELKTLSGVVLPASLEKLSNSEFRVKDAVEKVFLELSALAASREIELVFEGSEQTFLVTDRRIFENVLANLLGNALKFAPSPSRVRAVLLRPPSNSGLWQDGLLLQIIDSGPGLSQEQVEQVWGTRDRQTTERQTNTGIVSEKFGQGFGLGLAFCRLVLERCGARLSYSKEEGQSIFSLAFPSRQLDILEFSAVDGDRDRLPASESAVKVSPFLRKTVLLLCLPILFQGFLFGALAVSVLDSDKLLMQIKSRQEISAYAGRAWLNLFGGGYWTALSLAMQNSRYAEQASASLVTVRKLLTRLDLSSRNEMKDEALWRGVIPTVEGELSRLDSAFESTMASVGFGREDMLGSLAFSIKRGQLFSLRMMQVLSGQFRQIDEILSLQAQRFVFLQFQFLILTFLCLAFCIALPVVFSRNLVKRLEALAALACGGYGQISQTARDSQTTDADEIDRLQAKLVSMLDQLAENESIKERLITAIAHDVRSPIQNLVLLLEAGGSENSHIANRAQAERALSRFKRSLAIIQDLLVLQKLAAKAEALEPVDSVSSLSSVVSLQELLADQVAEFADEAGLKDVFIEMSGTFPEIRGDKSLSTLMVRYLIKFALSLCANGQVLVLKSETAAGPTLSAALTGDIREAVTACARFSVAAGEDIEAYALSLSWQNLTRLVSLTGTSLQVRYNKERHESLLEIDF
jgi:signal transduction histidine kinase